MKNIFIASFMALAAVGLFISCSAENESLFLEEEVSVDPRAVDYPTTGLSGMYGFAGACTSETGASISRTTGGYGGEVVYVTNLTDFQNAVSGTTSRTVVVAANISASSKTKVNLGSNKSIIGSYSAKTLKNVYLQAVNGTGNIIFQNLILAHDASINDNDDIQLYLNYGTNYWIDHVTFEGHSYDPNGSDLDKLLYIGVYADYITISQCKFMNHRYGLILGYPDDGSANAALYDGYPHLSIFNNYFENVYTRAPGLMRYGYFHVKNNYINNLHLAFTIAQNAKIYSEGNYFGDGAEKGGILDDKGTGWFTDSGSYPSIANKTSPATSWRPSTNYSGYQVQTAEYARDFARNWAGAQSSSSAWVFGY